MDRWVVALLLLLLFQGFIHFGLRRAFFFSDEGFYLTYGWLTFKGWTPYEDFFDNHFPGIHYVGALLFTMFGPSFEMTRIVVGLTWAITTITVFGIAKEFYDERMALMASSLLVLLELSSGGVWYVIEPFIALLSSLAILSFIRGGRMDVLLAGIFAGMTLIFKQPALPFFVFLAMYAFVKQRRALLFLSGSALPFLAFSLHLLNSGSLVSFIQDSVIFNILVKGLRDAGAYVVGCSDPFVICAWLILITASLSVKDGKGLIIGWFLTSSFFAFPRFSLFHLLPAAPPLSILAASTSGRMRRAVVLYIGAFLLLTIMLMAHVGFGRDDGLERSPPVLFIKERVPLEEKVVVLPFSPWMYFFSQREPAIHRVSIEPWTVDVKIEREMIEEMEGTDFKYLIYHEAKLSTLSGEQRLEDYAPMLKEYIKENYEEVERMGYVTVMKRR